jgi:hypothetical protein
VSVGNWPLIPLLPAQRWFVPAALALALAAAALAWCWRGDPPREPPAVLPDLGKGQRVGAAAPGGVVPQAVADVAELEQALARAGPSDVIEVAAGRYRLMRTLRPAHAGTAAAPITLRARVAGSVVFEVEAVQAVLVAQPHWRFENLDWRGTCASHDHCEHAFHVVGAAIGTAIVNNRMSDFNAHVKINGEGGLWPDDGLLRANTLFNTRPRATANPVVPIDLVAASGWQILDNHIRDSQRAAGNGASGNASYGLFMKGGGSGGRIERNLVICSSRDIAAPGQRVGISVGNGGTAPASCRGGRCDGEHTGALVANNVVAHCNDAGIDIAHARSAEVLHNTLVNTLGVLVRNAPADARVERNVFEGRLTARAATSATAVDNIVLPPTRARALDRLDLHGHEPPAALPAHPRVPLDFQGRRRGRTTAPGAAAAPD